MLSKKYEVEILSNELEYSYVQGNYYQQSIYDCVGDYICFASTSKQISMICAMAEQFNLEAFALIGVQKVSEVYKLLGIRDVSHTLPPIFQKQFLANNLELLNELDIYSFIKQLLKHADKTGYLCLSKAYISDSIFIAKPPLNKLYRPLFTILKKALLNRLKLQTPSREESIKYLKIHRGRIKYDKNIPVFINCRDRLDPLIELIDLLEKEGVRKIILVDNNSSYRPLLKYYETTPHKVFRLKRNIGQRAPWDSGLVSLLACNLPYIVTDPDILPSRSVTDSIAKLVNIMSQYPEYNKVGLALRIDNLPETYGQKYQVIKWENQFWKNKIEKNIYIADVDTTFALYRPNTPYIIRPALRVAGEYTAEHEPWYQDSTNPTDEYTYYLKHARREIASWGIDDATSSNVYKS